MIAMGIRVAPKEITYSILEITGEEISEINYNTNTLKIPLALNDDTPRQLSFIRTSFLSIISENNVSVAGLRTAETVANPDVFRMNVEGVIQELLSNSWIESYFTGKLNSIASKLNKPVQEITDCKNGEDIFDVQDWSKINSNKRESFLVGLAAYKKVAKS
ncbi:hypothetical protein [Salsuginibacillus kocurii]|uniref:hypothetical protein n=1 Tax=Salsuginibacillus kocurii TaxID=427078 RepID=UPI00036DFEC0|nr:hypothetical protein [Salsuginibacillus kocurii]